MTANQVKEVRERWGMSQSQAARVIGVSRKAWQKWEANERRCCGTAELIIKMYDESRWVRNFLKEHAEAAVASRKIRSSAKAKARRAAATRAGAAKAAAAS